MAETRVRELKYRMMITDLLKVASESHTYQELSDYLGLSPPILSRYMRGHVLPSYDRAQGLYEKLMEITDIKAELKKRIATSTRRVTSTTRPSSRRLPG